MSSRVYAGIHFRSAVEAGDRLGRRIGRFAFKHALRPLHCHAHGAADCPGLGEAEAR